MNLARRLRSRKIFLPPAAQNRLDPEEAIASGDESAAASAESASFRNYFVLTTRKQTEGRIVNGWLILTVIVGAAIALVDGAMRAPNPGLELVLPQPLEYEPYRAAFLFAGVTLPLLFAYAKKARLLLAETWFLWFVFCTTAYTKDFSYLRLPGAPVFVTDVTLVALLLLVYLAPRPHRSGRPLVLNISLLFFVAAGILEAARGFFANREPLLVLRDSALVVYSLFFLTAYHLLPNWSAIRRLSVWFASGAALNVVNGLAWFVAAPDQRRFVFPGIYVLISLVGVFVLMANGRISSHIGWILVGVFSVGLWLANSRSLFVCFVVMFLVTLGIPRLFPWNRASARLVSGLVFSAAILSFFALVFFHSPASLDFTNRVADNMSSGILHLSDDPYWQFRLTAWREAWRRFQEYPAAGEGFGKLFNFEIWDNDPRPHNTFLTVLYKMGLLGFLPFLTFLASFFWSTLRTARESRTCYGAPFLQILILAQVSFCIWGGADAVLESPYLASLFWVGMGLGSRMVEKLNFNYATSHLEKLRIGCEQLSRTSRLANARG